MIPIRVLVDLSFTFTNQREPVISIVLVENLLVGARILLFELLELGIHDRVSSLLEAVLLNRNVTCNILDIFDISFLGQIVRRVQLVLRE